MTPSLAYQLTDLKGNEKINAIVQLIQQGINHERASRKLPQLVFDVG